MKEETRERQYQVLLEDEKSKGIERFGVMSSQVWRDDPRRVAFVLSRYKFVAKMFSGMNHVLEVGCADAFGTRVVLQEVKALTATDFDPLFVELVKKNMTPRWQFECLAHDMMAGPLGRGFDGAYAVDVIEHIPVEEEERFVGNIVGSLNATGVCLFGSPSIHSQPYASAQSREGHVNCKDAPGLKTLMQKFFHNVFIFSMNDEVVHTGFYPMAQYLWALCCHKKSA
jgi:cyclopropane fatty-acyl-phospholipid synthase-like methyltransferase